MVPVMFKPLFDARFGVAKAEVCFKNPSRERRPEKRPIDDSPGEINAPAMKLLRSLNFRWL